MKKELNQTTLTQFVIIMVTVILLLLATGVHAGGNPLIPLYGQQPQIITPYELQGIGSFEQRQRQSDYEYQQRLRDAQQYQYQQEQLEELKRLNDELDR